MSALPQRFTLQQALILTCAPPALCRLGQTPLYKPEREESQGAMSGLERPVTRVIALAPVLAAISSLQITDANRSCSGCCLPKNAACARPSLSKLTPERWPDRVGPQNLPHLAHRHSTSREHLSGRTLREDTPELRQASTPSSYARTPSAFAAPVCHPCQGLSQQQLACGI
jgi:hypothetical protein